MILLWKWMSKKNRWIIIKNHKIKFKTIIKNNLLKKQSNFQKRFFKLQSKITRQFPKSWSEFLKLSKKKDNKRLLKKALLYSWFNNKFKIFQASINYPNTKEWLKVSLREWWNTRRFFRCIKILKEKKSSEFILEQIFK